LRGTAAAAAAAAALLLTTVACATGGTGLPGAAVTTTNPATTALTTTDPATGAGLAANGARAPVPGFGEVAYRISAMPSALRCALLAETAQQRAQGLMNRRDLAGYDGMLFDFASPVNVGFWMKDTPLPLSIAYFDGDGRFVSAVDMAPCLGRGNNCPSYPASGPFRYALEVAQGGLGALGVGPGAVLTTAGPCS